ncbi:MAG: YicC family protein [Planctomycetaceae bacterium]|nr:YicC family protein [Planctomycetaceae bacterium]MCB9938139.1 YicC family protein [Planctomycetaceae bacterium]
MTGQGSAHVTEEGVSVAAEVRTVNSRYFKLALRTSEGYGPLEPKIEEVVRRYVRRGTVQLDLRVERQAAADDFRLNETALASYQRQLTEVARKLKLDSQVTLESLLALPGVVDERVSRNVDTDAEWPVVERTLVQALEGLTKMRTEEGTAMATDMAAQCQSIGQALDSVAQRAPLVTEGYRDRLTERMNKLLAEFEVRVEASDVIREVGLFSERSDISEEVVRLRHHLEQFDAIMGLDESSGRKLEFITQEMFRESNTIGSKANDGEIGRHVIDIKAAIERIREMIQNVE